MITSTQVQQHGITRVPLQRAADAGVLERLVHGVYRMAGAPSEQYEGLRTAWLSMEPDRTAAERLDDEPTAVVVGSTATWLHGVGDLDPVPYDVATATRTRTRRDDVRTTTRRMNPQDVTIRHGLPVCTLERTITDLILDDTDVEHLADIVRAPRLIDFGMISRHIEHAPVRRRARGRTVVKHLVGVAANSALSELESMDPSSRSEVLAAIAPSLLRLSEKISASLAR